MVMATAIQPSYHFTSTSSPVALAVCEGSRQTLGPRSTPPILYQTGLATTGVDEEGLPTEIGGPDGLGFGYIVNPETGRIETQQVFTGRRRADPFGGNVVIEGSAEVLFPMPFVKDRSSIRSAFFLDAGNVFNTNCRQNQLNCFGVDANELRYSVGIGVTWLSGFGPLTFALAKPLNASDTDRTGIPVHAGAWILITNQEVNPNVVPLRRRIGTVGCIDRSTRSRSDCCCEFGGGNFADRLRAAAFA